MVHIKFNRYPNKRFSKQHITQESVFFFFFSFMIQGSDKSLISDGPSFLWSCCQIWHREMKSWNFIRYCLRKVYWKILHCRLWRMWQNTHVSIDDDIFQHQKPGLRTDARWNCGLSIFIRFRPETVLHFSFYILQRQFYTIFKMVFSSTERWLEKMEIHSFCFAQN